MLQWESMRYFPFRKSGQSHTHTHTRTFWLFNIDFSQTMMFDRCTTSKLIKYSIKQSTLIILIIQLLIACASILLRKSGQSHTQTHRHTHTRTFWLFNIDFVTNLPIHFKIFALHHCSCKPNKGCFTKFKKDSRLFLKIILP